MQSGAEAPASSCAEELPGAGPSRREECRVMLIEVFYVPGCPNHQPAVRRLRKVLRLQAVNVSVHEIPVTDDLAARALRFPGSPTVRIDGVDAEPVEQQPFGLTCRLEPKNQLTIAAARRVRCLPASLLWGARFWHPVAACRFYLSCSPLARRGVRRFLYKFVRS